MNEENETKVHVDEPVDEPKDLWGNIPDPAPDPTPRAILREQADLLSSRTNQVLLGVVKANTNPGNELWATLSIRAPFLNKYEIDLIDIAHPILIYPVTVYSKFLTLPEAERPERAGFVELPSITCNNREEFVRAVANVLQSEEVHKIIGALLTQSKSP